MRNMKLLNLIIAGDNDLKFIELFISLNHEVVYNAKDIYL